MYGWYHRLYARRDTANERGEGRGRRRNAEVMSSCAIDVIEERRIFRCTDLTEGILETDAVTVLPPHQSTDHPIVLRCIDRFPRFYYFLNKLDMLYFPCCVSEVCSNTFKLTMTSTLELLNTTQEKNI